MIMSYSSTSLSQFEAEQQALNPPEISDWSGRPRLKVLVCAFACNPTRGSEFGVGWGWVKAIAKNHDVSVITADFNSGDIERYLVSHEDVTTNNPRFIYVKNRPWHYRPQGVWLKIEGSLAKPLMNLAYQDWLRCAFEEARREIAQDRYDLVHLITYVGWRFPGSFYQLDIPFVWGPIGGLKNTPWPLFPALGIKGAIYYGARNLVNSLQIKLLPGPRRALRQAQGGVIAATSEIQQALMDQFGTTSRVICEVGLPDVGPVEPRPRESSEALRICWSGLHLPGKALHLLLRATARLPRNISYRLHILGDGPSNREWRSLAKQLRIEDNCEWHGQLPRDRALAIMKSCHVFVITSLKELTSTVAVEAIALGLPVVCIDHCGFADLITKECGIKVRPGSVPQITSDLAKALTCLGEDEQLRMQLAQGSLLRSRDYSWPRKSVSIDEVYDLALELQKASYRNITYT